MIDEIKSQISIVDLLSRLGIVSNNSGFIKSIYKNEKSPSLKIYPNTNSYFCFATNKGGDLIDFYSDYCNVDKSTSIKEISDLFGIRKVEFNSEYRENKPFISENSPPVYNLLNSEKEYFLERSCIIEYDSGIAKNEAEKLTFDLILEQRKTIQRKVFKALYEFCISKNIEDRAYKYLTGKDRGLDKLSLHSFKIFTIHSGRETINFLKDTFERDEIILAGLFSKKYFIFSKHRIVIPYIEGGEITYLRGRYFYNGNSKPESFGKYIGLNNYSKTLSPKRFYNIDLLKTLVPNSDLILSEGEFDSIIANQTGNNCIGISGVSNFPRNQIELLKPFNIYLAFDNDEAGRRAAGKIGSLFKQPISLIKLKVHKDITELLK